MSRLVQRLTFAALFGAFFILPGCSSDGGAGPSGPTPNSIVIIGASVLTGDAGQPIAGPLQVRVLDSSSAPISGVSVSWTVVAGGGSITPQSSTTSGDGVASATWTLGGAAGAQTARATIGSLSADFTANADPGDPANVTVTPSAATLTDFGATVDLSAEVTDAFGNVLGDAVTWSSNAEGAASVDGNGRVTAVSAGVATITAESGSASGMATITVDVPTNFEPTSDVTLSGTIDVLSVNIPAGVTVTATGDLTFNSSGPVRIDGILTGDCVSIQVNGQDTGIVTGQVSNACANHPPGGGPDLSFIVDGAMTLTGAMFMSSGDSEIKNNPLLTPDDFQDINDELPTLASGLGLPLQAGGNAGGDCVIANTTVMAMTGNLPVLAPGTPGLPGMNLLIGCDGNLFDQGGNMFAAGDPVPGGPPAPPGGDPNEPVEQNGADGEMGGTETFIVSGDLDFDGANGPSTFTVPDGDSGKPATASAIGDGQDATAKGGDGGDGGDLWIAAGGGITISPGGLIIVAGSGGHGASGTANSGKGRDANGEPAGKGGTATATGGKGGNSTAGRLRARGNVQGRSNIQLTGGNGGNGGDATANGGAGGNGSFDKKPGGMGGNMSATGGAGGNARTRSISGVTIGKGGDGGDANFSGGVGGIGGHMCTPMVGMGGPGGMGGTASGTPGEGGTGRAIDGDGDNGSINVAAETARGGMGGDGIPVGTGGPGGTDQITTDGKFTRNPDGENAFQMGDDGMECVVPPEAEDNFAQTPKNTPVSIMLNGSDLNGDPLSPTIKTQPAHGTLTDLQSKIDGTGGLVTYTPAPGYVGPDMFEFILSDGNGGMAMAEVVVHVLSTEQVFIATGANVLMGDPMTKEVQSFPIPNARRITTSMDGSILYVLSGPVESPTSLYSVEVGTGVMTHIMSFPAGTTDIHVIPDGPDKDKIIASNPLEGTTYILNPNGSIAGMFEATEGAYLLGTSAGGEKIFTAGEDEFGGFVDVTDGTTLLPVGQIDMPDGSFPQGFTPSADGSKVYIPVTQVLGGFAVAAFVYVYDVAAMEVVKIIELTGAFSATSVAVHPDGSKVYVGDSAGSKVLIIDGMTDTQIEGPNGNIDVDPSDVPDFVGVSVTKDGFMMILHGANTTRVRDMTTGAIMDGQFSYPAIFDLLLAH